MRHALLNIRSPRWCASWRAAAALIALCVAVYVPGLSALPVVDRDEARFAQASRQMFESVALPAGERDPAMHAGGLIVPMVQDRERLSKPPLIYWLQGAAAAAFTGGEPTRDAIWMYRVPSLLAAFLTVLVTWRIGLSMFDPRAAFLAGVLLAVCPLFVWEARQARADHVLTVCTVAAMWGLWEVWRRSGRGRSGSGASGGREGSPVVSPAAQAITVAGQRSVARRAVPWRWAILLWVSVALGTLTKGPITPMVLILSAVTLSTLTRRWAWLKATRPVLGVMIVAAALAPWLMLLGERYGLARYMALVYDETIGRAGSPRENHFGPPGYHLVLLIATFWPGSIVAGMSIARAWRRTIRGVRPWKWRAFTPTVSRAGELFCLAWIIPAWIMFEVSATKLPHYPMPLFPALALLSARTLLAVSAGSVPMAWGRLASTVYVLWLGVTAIVGIGFVAASLLLFDGAWQGAVGVAMPLALVLLTLQIVLFSRVMWSLARRRIARATRGAVWMGIIAWVLVLGLIVPRAPSLWVTRAVVRSLESRGWKPGQPLVSRFHEGSLVFEARGRVHLAKSPAALEEFLVAHPGELGVIRARDLHQYTRVVAVATIRGFNIGRTAREHLLMVWAPEPRQRRPTPEDGRLADEIGGPP